MNTRRPLLCFGILCALLLVGLVGCSTPATNAASATPSSGAATTYAWHDPYFYDPWFDSDSIVLPPPPFTGVTPHGKTAPFLPIRPRPTDGN